MINPNGILMVEPSGTISPSPLIDELTRKMTAALRASRPGNRWRGCHTCACGAQSDNRDYWVGKGKELLTNSLAVHYLARHRTDVPEAELEKVRMLTNGEMEPTAKELG